MELVASGHHYQTDNEQTQKLLAEFDTLFNVVATLVGATLPQVKSFLVHDCLHSDAFNTYGHVVRMIAMASSSKAFLAEIAWPSEESRGNLTEAFSKPMACKNSGLSALVPKSVKTAWTMRLVLMYSTIGIRNNHLLKQKCWLVL